jgi:hypothetical protein
MIISNQPIINLTPIVVTPSTRKQPSRVVKQNQGADNNNNKPAKVKKHVERDLTGAIEITTDKIQFYQLCPLDFYKDNILQEHLFEYNNAQKRRQAPEVKYQIFQFVMLQQLLNQVQRNASGRPILSSIDDAPNLYERCSRVMTLATCVQKQAYQSFKCSCRIAYYRAKRYLAKMIEREALLQGHLVEVNGSNEQRSDIPAVDNVETKGSINMLDQTLSNMDTLQQVEINSTVILDQEVSKARYHSATAIQLQLSVNSNDQTVSDQQCINGDLQPQDELSKAEREAIANREFDAELVERNIGIPNFLLKNKDNNVKFDLGWDQFCIVTRPMTVEQFYEKEKAEKKAREAASVAAAASFAAGNPPGTSRKRKVDQVDHQSSKKKPKRDLNTLQHSQSEENPKSCSTPIAESESQSGGTRKEPVFACLSEILLSNFCFQFHGHLKRDLCHW